MSVSIRKYAVFKTVVWIHLCQTFVSHFYCVRLCYYTVLLDGRAKISAFAMFRDIVFNAICIIALYVIEDVISPNRASMYVCFLVDTSSTHHQHISTSSAHQQHKSSTHQHVNTSTQSSTHQHINTSTHQHINTSTHQHINTSTHQHINTSTHQHINTSSHQHIITSSHQHIITSTYQHINIST